ncbi:MAG: hypothetical protein E3J60_03455 [Dehalococcoidia bacterium]|nr:MAG: hypothetical protein E3J60_03455 [Dehalococcoidia bacterium]
MATIVDSWKLLRSIDVTLAPREEEVAGWKLLRTIELILAPSTEVVSGWKLLDSKTITLSPPTMECSADADCPEGYVCEDGVCVPKAGFPWIPVAIGAAVIGGVILIISVAQKKRMKE